MTVSPDQGRRRPNRLLLHLAGPALRHLAHGRWERLMRDDLGHGGWPWLRLNLSVAAGIRAELIEVDGIRVRLTEAGREAAARQHVAQGER